VIIPRDLTVAVTCIRLFIPESREQRHNLSDFGDEFRNQTAAEMVHVCTIIRIFVHRQCEAREVCFNNGRVVVTKAQHIPSPDRSVDDAAGRCCRDCFPNPQAGPNWPRVAARCRSDDACIDTFSPKVVGVEIGRKAAKQRIAEEAGGYEEVRLWRVCMVS
jgi:hypothetical protein